MSKRKKKDEERNVENSSSVSTKHGWAKNSTKHKTECNVRIIMRGVARSRNNVASLFIYTIPHISSRRNLSCNESFGLGDMQNMGISWGSSTYVIVEVTITNMNEIGLDWIGRKYEYEYDILNKCHCNIWKTRSRI